MNSEPSIDVHSHAGSPPKAVTCKQESCAVKNHYIIMSWQKTKNHPGFATSQPQSVVISIREINTFGHLFPSTQHLCYDVSMFFERDIINHECCDILCSSESSDEARARFRAGNPTRIFDQHFAFRDGDNSEVWLLQSKMVW